MRDTAARMGLITKDHLKDADAVAKMLDNADVEHYLQEMAFVEQLVSFPTDKEKEKEIKGKKKKKKKKKKEKLHIETVAHMLIKVLYF